ncbi:hypothetical protein EGT07_08045 [Herbaspirillum sp. HC18]|nr:hypothetical protein EGT07_08045 [Herbaspirillum sp. HC18]
MAEREANTRPARGICPPPGCGFERLAAMLKTWLYQKTPRSFIWHTLLSPRPPLACLPSPHP